MLLGKLRTADVTWTTNAGDVELIQAHVTWPSNEGGCYLDNKDTDVTWTLTQRMSLGQYRRMLLGQLIQVDVTWASNAG